MILKLLLNVIIVIVIAVIVFVAFSFILTVMATIILIIFDFEVIIITIIVFLFFFLLYLIRLYEISPPFPILSKLFFYIPCLQTDLHLFLETFSNHPFLPPFLHIVYTIFLLNNHYIRLRPITWLI